MVFVVKRQHILRRENEIAKSCSIRVEGYGKSSEKNGITAQANEALKSPVVETSPSMWQTLYLVTLNTNLSRASLEDIVDFLKKRTEKRALKFSQVTDAKHILKHSTTSNAG